MLEEIREEKIKKLKNFKEKGIEPYPSESFEKEELKSVSGKTVGEKVQVAGRIMLLRNMGNITFLHLQDESGRMQVVLNKKKLDEDYKFWTKNLDIGDFLGVSGERFDTQKGEKSVLAKKLTLLSKSILPLPDKFKGLENDDKRQRMRELEMISDQEVLQRFKRRGEATKVIREMMWKENFNEIETPILQNVYGGTYAKPFTTHYNSLDFDLFLRIAPEIFLKRSVTGGFEKVFEIGKCFRNEGMDPSHLQEFTMFEFYWPYVDYKALMGFTEKLISEIVEKVYDGNYKVNFGGNEIDLKPPYKRITFRELVKEYLKVDFSELDTAEKIGKYVEENNLQNKVNLEGKISWSAKIDELYKKTIRNKITQPIFVTDYPKEFMALAKTKGDDPETVATFQLVVNTWELIKAYNELNDPIDQKERFEAQERLSLEGDEEAMPYDHDFVESMEYGMPPMAGWGMGLDRFFSLLEGEENLRDLVIFPTMKPKEKNGKVTGGDDKKEVTQDLGIDNAEAEKLVGKHITEEVTRLHSVETEIIMRALAKHFGEDEGKWGVIGLLHDIDWDLTKDDVKNHTIKSVEILKDAGASDFLIETIVSHGWGDNGCGEDSDKERQTKLQHCLAAAETLTGLIVASALMQPDKKLSSVKLKSLKKKFKSKSFAANCNREIIKECEQAGISLDGFLEIGLKALQRESKKLGM